MNIPKIIWSHKPCSPLTWMNISLPERNERNNGELAKNFLKNAKKYLDHCLKQSRGKSNIRTFLMEAKICIEQTEKHMEFL
ncbi:hypothetical protein HYV57_04120 [Candidatus Peregrinibacteria bacterium]|nr:hypothetical protein [Candidatus Peregrinibacteria bacterium]